MSKGIHKHQERDHRPDEAWSKHIPYDDTPVVAVHRLDEWLDRMTYEEYNILVSSLYYSLTLERVTQDEFTIGLRTLNRLYNGTGIE